MSSRSVNKEATIDNILAKRSPFVSIDERKLREKAYQSGGVKFLRQCAKAVRSQIVYGDSKDD